MRVLFMSGYTDDEVMRRGVIDGRTAFLQKPFTPGQFAKKVREVLDQNGAA
jgi:FixJ family two-component response regulator